MSADAAMSRVHSHDFLGDAHDANARRTRLTVAITIVTMVLEVAAGLFTGSMALLADGVHMATHAGALGLAAAAYAYARKHAADPRYCFGTGKVGDLAAFASAIVLGVVALAIAAESIGRLFNPRAVEFGPAILVAVLGLLVNLVCAAILSGGHHHGHEHGHGHGHGHSHDHAHGDGRSRSHGHGHDNGHDHDHPSPTDHSSTTAHTPSAPHADPGAAAHAHPTDPDETPRPAAPAGTDNNLRAAYVHVLADALTSVLAIAALIAGLGLGWTWLDPVVALLGAVIIGRWAVGLIRDTAGTLLDRTDAALAADIRRRCAGAVITDLHVWRVGPQACAAIVSVETPTEASDIREALATLPALRHLTVECR